MFLDNKYTKLYWKLIDNARKRLINIGYIEKHHIIPVSLGGTNDSENLVVFTAKEHYIAHRLLCKMVEGRSKYLMAFAIIQMSNTTRGRPRYVPSSITYVKLKEELSKTMREYAASLSQEARNAKWGTMLGKVPSTESNMKRSRAISGRKYTKEQVVNISKGRMGIKFSDKQCKAISIALSGVKHTIERKAKTSVVMTEWWIKRKSLMAAGV